MDKRLLSPAIQAFIREHEQDDPVKLMLQKDKYAGLPLKAIVGQIKARKKAKKKLPAWYATDGVLFPQGVAVEQASSATTANYKAGLCRGATALDLTGGMGVDSYFLAKTFQQVTYVEKDTELTTTAGHNFKILGQENIEIINSSAEEFLAANQKQFDLIYLDPDRRPGSKRVVSFADSRPDLPALLPQLFKFTENVLVKASPMMDIATGICQLERVKMVVVLAVDNENKELLFLLAATPEKTIQVRCVNVVKYRNEIFTFDFEDKNQAEIIVSLINKYLYEPNAAVMKAGPFGLLCRQYGLAQLHPNTHLFTAKYLNTDFPGRVFRVIADVAYKPAQILPLLPEKRANISTRNFPDSPIQVKQKLGLNDGGNRYLFGYRNLSNKLRIAVCEKITQSEL